MATYPIKMLNDENNNAFIPLTSSAAVMDENGLSIDHLMNEGKYKIQNNLTTEEAGIGVLDASQGKVLKDYVDNNRYTLSIASSETLGGIKVGENLEILEDGTLNAKGGGGGYAPPVCNIYYMEDFPEESYKDRTFISIDCRKTVYNPSVMKNALALAVDDANSKWGRAWSFIFATKTDLVKNLVVNGNENNGGHTTRFSKNTFLLVTRVHESDYYFYAAVCGESSSGFSDYGLISKGSYYSSVNTDPAKIQSVTSQTNFINIFSPRAYDKIATKEYVDQKMTTLPIASSSTLGAIKVGKSLKISGDGTLDAQDPQDLCDKGFIYETIIPGQLNYKVEDVSGSSYNFVLNADGYYESTNKGIQSSYALCKVTFNVDTETEVAINYINSGENNYDYGIFSQLDKTLSLSATSDGSSGSTNVKKNCRNESSLDVRTITYVIPEGEHFIYIKYIKDGSDNQGNDSLQFKIIDESSYKEYTTEYMATKKYVDDSIADIPQPDLNNYYTKEEVDSMINNILNQLTYVPAEEEKTNISNILGEDVGTIEYDMTNTEVNNALDEVIGGNE